MLVISRLTCLVTVSVVAQAAETFIDVTNLSLPSSSGMDKLPDYSFAGAYYSSVPLPAIDRPASVTIRALPDMTDRTQEIQAAIDMLSLRGGGVIQMQAGTFHVMGATIRMFTQNVTIRGSSPSGGITNFIISGQPRYVFRIGDPDARPQFLDTAQSLITSDYVPIGADTLQVEDASSFKVGQEVQIRKTLSAEFIHLMGMDTLVRDGKKQTWISPGRLAVTPRQIKSIDLSNHEITLDVPLADSINRSMGANGLVWAYELPEKVASGNSIENIAFTLAKDESGAKLTDVSFDGIAAFSAYSQDNWIRQVNGTGFMSFFTTEANSRRVTFQDVTMFRPSACDKAAGYPADIMLRGYTALVHRGTSIGVPGSKSWSVATGSLAPGPQSVVEYTSYRPEHIVEPHERFAYGFLVDNSNVGGASLINRATGGTGHGWAVGAATLWNVRAVAEIAVESPPLSFAVAVGCVAGSFSPKSTPRSFISSGTPVSPTSLFQAQLSSRLGDTIAGRILAPAGGQSLDKTVASGMAVPSITIKVEPTGHSGYLLIQSKEKRCRLLQRSKRGSAVSAGQTLSARMWHLACMSAIVILFRL